jgi:hypothetical protein
MWRTIHRAGPGFISAFLERRHASLKAGAAR